MHHTYLSLVAATHSARARCHTHRGYRCHHVLIRCFISGHSDEVKSIIRDQFLRKCDGGRRNFHTMYA